MTTPRLVKLNEKFLSGAAETGLEIVPPATDADLVNAFTHNIKFPDRQIDLGHISAKAAAGQDIKFGEGNGQVSFKGGASAFAGLGVYPDPEKLLAALALEDNIAPGLNLGKDPGKLCVALRWGYDINGSAKGSLALGAPGSITFSGTGKREAIYAVVRRFDKEIGALTAVEKTAQSWMLPSQVRELDDLEPGTWLIAEVDGSVGVKLGVQYGYDFNWIREARLGGLTGDIGLRLQLGVSAAFNFAASGNYAVVISRDPQDDTDQRLRFRLFKLRRKGWGFAFDAGATVQGDFSDFLPKFDDFIKAVFGVHGAQVLKDLQAIEKWTNPDQDLADILGQVSVDYARKLLEEVTGLDAENAFTEAKGRLLEFINRWNKLPHNVATTLWKLAEEKVDLTEVRNMAQGIVDANPDTAKKLFAKSLGNVDFFQTPVGRWLAAGATDGVLRALTGPHEFEELQRTAHLTLDVLDGSAIEGVLEKLQSFVEERLNLQRNLKLDQLGDLDQATFNQLDEWLRARLSAFLDQELDLAKVNEIRKAIFLFIQRGRGFYDKTLKALNRKYEFNFAYTYQRSTTNTALLDIDFDFGVPQVADSLQEALSGQYDRLLVEQRPGVTLNAAALTHQMERSSHVEVNLPWFKSALDHINSSLAKVEAVDEDEGRLLIYELDSKDIVVEKSKRNSRLAVGGYLQVKANEVRVYATDQLSYSYSFRQVKRNMKRADLQYQLKPYIDTYFKGAFAPGNNGDGSFVNWIGDLDNQIDALEFNGTDNFGHTLIGMELSVPAAVVSSWLKAPPEDDEQKVPQYLNMSRRLQAKMKEIVPFYYFQNLDKFKDIGPASVLLVYSSIPPSTSIKLDGNSLTLNSDRDYYWDYVDKDKRRAMALARPTTVKLTRTLEQVYNLLRESGMTGTADFYQPERALQVQREAVAGNNDNLLLGLFSAERKIIDTARHAGYEIAKFSGGAGAKPSEAVKALAKFGSNLTKAFNKDVSTIYVGGALRPLGTSLFIEAAAVLNPGVPVDTTAMLDLMVLKQQPNFDMSKFLDGDVPEKDDILIQQRLVDLT